MASNARKEQPAPVEPEQPAPDATPRPFMSEGTRQDLEAVGRAVEPGTGTRFELDREAGVVTATDLSGAVTRIEWRPTDE